MSWFGDNQLLLSGLVLAALVVVGVVVLVVRARQLLKIADASRGRVDPAIAAINAGLLDAERRVDRIAVAQTDLSDTIERVEASTEELRFLMGHAGRAYDVLRTPLGYAVRYPEAINRYLGHRTVFRLFRK